MDERSSSHAEELKKIRDELKAINHEIVSIKEQLIERSSRRRAFMPYLTLTLWLPILVAILGFVLGYYVL